MWVDEAGRELGKREQHSRNSMCKGPEAGSMPSLQRNWKEARVTRAPRKGVWWAWNQRLIAQGLVVLIFNTMHPDCQGPEG